MAPPEVAAAEQLLPLWVRWGALLAAPVIALPTALAVRRHAKSAAARALALPQEPWWSYAREAYAARMTARSALLAGIILGFSLALVKAGGSSFLHAAPLVAAWLAGVGALWLGVFFAHRQVRVLRPPELLLEGGSASALLLMRGGIVALLLIIPAVVVPSWAVTLACLIACGGVMLVMGTLVLLVLRLTSAAQPASDKLREAVNVAAGQLGRPPPPTFEVRLPMANAFALPDAQALCFSRAAVRMLEPAHLTAIARHELDHLDDRGPWLTSRALVVLAVATPVLAMHVPTSTLLLRLLVLLAALLVSLALVLLARRVRRRMEHHADHTAHARGGDSPEYARALELLYRFNRVPAVLGRARGVHPELYDRMLAAGVQPDYPRPLPPKIPRPVGVVLTALLTVLAVSIALAIPFHPQTEAAALWTLAVKGGDADALGLLAREAAARGDVRKARYFAVAAREEDRADPELTVFLAQQEMNDGECGRALRHLDQVRWDEIPINAVMRDRRIEIETVCAERGR